MNNGTSYSFSFSYDLTAEPAAAPAVTDLVAFDICREYALPDNQVLLRSSQSGRQTVVTGDVLYSLHQCAAFRSLAEHNRRLQKLIPELAGQEQEINSVLNSVLDAGLMLSAASKTRELQPTPEDASPADRSISYCILTCDRPQAAERLLDSMRQTHDFSPGNRYWLVDDSRAPDNRKANQELCNILQREHGIPLEYFGPRQQAHALARMKQVLPEHTDGLDFLLGRAADESIPSYGRSRNWALLLGAGTPLVLVDDDVLYQRARTPHGSDDVALASTSRSADFYSSDDDWQHLLDQETPDPGSGAFTMALGRTLPAALALFTREELPAEALRHLLPIDYHHFQPWSKIRITSCGSLGDPGTSGNQWLLQLDAGSRRRLHATEALYRQHLQQRNLWSGRGQATFLNSFTLISQVTGLDATELLPPYFPIQRNEDLLFGEMLRYLHPDALQLDLPWAVPHLPLNRRNWDREQLTRPAPYGMLSFSAEMLARNRQQNPAEAASIRMESMAALFFSLSDMPDTNLIQSIAEATLARYAAQINHLNDILAESSDAPGYWRHDVQTYMANLQQAMFAPLPEGFALMEGDARTRRATARALWARFARGLGAWENAMNWARENL
ncbi:hypothetical protein [Thiolapillus sp.]